MHLLYLVSSKQCVLQQPLNKLENKQNKCTVLALFHWLLKTPPILKYLCFFCCSASNIIDEMGVDSHWSPKIQLTLFLQLVAFTLQPSLVSVISCLLPPLITLPFFQTLFMTFFLIPLKSLLPAFHISFPYTPSPLPIQVQVLQTSIQSQS